MGCRARPIALIGGAACTNASEPCVLKTRHARTLGLRAHLRGLLGTGYLQPLWSQNRSPTGPKVTPKWSKSYPKVLQKWSQSGLLDSYLKIAVSEPLYGVKTAPQLVPKCLQSGHITHTPSHLVQNDSSTSCLVDPGLPLFDLLRCVSGALPSVRRLCVLLPWLRDLPHVRAGRPFWRLATTLDTEHASGGGGARMYQGRNWWQ